MERIVKPPSMVELAARSIRQMILSGELLPGERVVENRLTGQLGISRPPLREALRRLEHEGLIRQSPHKGAVVTPLTLHDVYEIMTLRHRLEDMAVDLGIPVAEPDRLDRCWASLRGMERAADARDEAALMEHKFEFHAAVVGLSGHRRLEEAYRSLQMQMQLCMALNRQARAHRNETAATNVLRHRRLLRVIEEGDPEAVRAELARHGDQTFLDDLPGSLEPGSDQALRWLKSVQSAPADPGKRG
ncbi:GntR family transcriptional regulator [Nocardiopsis composta]|uniref:DNA-binding GntR family transcriptional regulator n=1 Tax=Nocardiopsis composta TaxID=157465 RepID=A0A7W8VGG5_9ACTN|nr:GntR family transcriptional regulator [Nocardiopsis composta]MBB5435462.1 DNA-binding GntR family transcriptional regulator [Nocardiopsis composta]